MRVQSVGCCPVCAATTRRALHAGLTDHMRPTASETWRLWRCGTCGSAFLDPRPADDAIAEAYETYYTHRPPALELAPVGLAATVRRGLRNGYVNRRFGYALSPSLGAAGELVRLSPALHGTIERSFRSLPLGDRLLDAGCANGEWIANMSAAGWSAAGIDVDAQALDAARTVGLDVRCEELVEHAADHESTYDAITVSHVIEHVAQPVEMLRAARMALRPGGRVWVATPNLEALGHRRHRGAWIGLDPPRHFVLFTAASLRRALVEAGFFDVRHVTHAPIAGEWFPRSAAIAQGQPLDPDRPAGGAPRERAAAQVAEWAARRNPRHGEELVVVATA